MIIIVSKNWLLLIFIVQHETLDEVTLHHLGRHMRVYIDDVSIKKL